MIPRLSRLIASVVLVFTSLAAPVAADDGTVDNPVVVELFTSQGCSSCPPADKLMHDLAEREDVIALALHVDYWDYIGWKDEFASPAHSKRQRAYARTMGARTVYTPQLIVQGSDSIVGAKAMKLADQIAAHKAKDSSVTVNLTRQDSRLRIAAQVAKGAKGQGDMVVHMLRYVPEREVKITRGENAGRHMRYANVVQDWRVLAEWSGGEPLLLDAALEGDAPVVVLIQEAGPGAIIAAARLR